MEGGGGWAHLCIELDVGGAKADEAGEEGLVQMTILLKGHVLDHRRQLVVVPDQDDTLQPAIPILLSLQACTCMFVYDALVLRQDGEDTCIGLIGLGFHSLLCLTLCRC